MPDEALWAVACQAAQGLAFLHSHGVMHLDIKPDNIYLSAAGLPQGGSSSSSAACCGGCSGGTWRIGDFGLAVARGQDGSMVRGWACNRLKWDGMRLQTAWIQGGPAGYSQTPTD